MLTDKTVVITGGNGRIARATATALSNQGAKIVLLVRDRLGEAQAFVDSTLSGSGHQALMADVTDTGSLRSAVTQISHCDILINCLKVNY